MNINNNHYPIRIWSILKCVFVFGKKQFIYKIWIQGPIDTPWNSNYAIISRFCILKNELMCFWQFWLFPFTKSIASPSVIRVFHSSKTNNIYCQRKQKFMKKQKTKKTKIWMKILSIKLTDKFRVLPIRWNT